LRTFSTIRTFDLTLLRTSQRYRECALANLTPKMAETKSTTPTTRQREGKNETIVRSRLGLTIENSLAARSGEYRGRFAASALVCVSALCVRERHGIISRESRKCRHDFRECRGGSLKGRGTSERFGQQSKVSPQIHFIRVFRSLRGTEMRRLKRLRRRRVAAEIFHFAYFQDFQTDRPRSIMDTEHRYGNACRLRPRNGRRDALVSK